MFIINGKLNIVKLQFGIFFDKKIQINKNINFLESII